MVLPPTIGSRTAGARLRPLVRVYGRWVNSNLALLAQFRPGDDNILASAGEDKTIRLLDVSDPRTAIPIGQPLSSHSDSVTS